MPWRAHKTATLTSFQRTVTWPHRLVSVVAREIFDFIVPVSKIRQLKYIHIQFQLMLETVFL